MKGEKTRVVRHPVKRRLEISTQQTDAKGPPPVCSSDHAVVMS